MSRIIPVGSLRKLVDYLADQVGGTTMSSLRNKSPCAVDDIHEQIRATAGFSQSFKEEKNRGHYLRAAAYQVENLRYYIATGDGGRSGHVLIEISDCLFSAGHRDASVMCCEEAIPLLLRSRDNFSWARLMAGVGELLLAAISLNALGVHDALAEIRRATSALSAHERRILFREDGHRISRRLISAYRLRTREPLIELEGMRPMRKTVEKDSLFAFLEEVADRYRAVKLALEGVP